MATWRLQHVLPSQDLFWDFIWWDSQLDVYSYDNETKRDYEFKAGNNQAQSLLCFAIKAWILPDDYLWIVCLFAIIAFGAKEQFDRHISTVLWITFKNNSFKFGTISELKFDESAMEVY